MALTYDVVVVGGGIAGGLSSAAYLQKAGLDVAVVEKRHELGTFAPTAEPWPGLIASLHACQNWAPVSPAVDDLELEKYGFSAIFSRTPQGSTHKDGTNLLLYTDPAMTGQAFARFSKSDGETIEKLQAALLGDAVELCEQLFFQPPESHPSDVMEAAMSAGRYLGIDPDTFSKMSGIELLDHVFESEHVKQTLAVFTTHNYFGHILAHGQGAFAVLASFFALSAAGWNIGGIHTVTHSVNQCYKDHGGTIFRNCPVERILVQDGEAVGVQLSEDATLPGENIYANHAVISDVGAKGTLNLVGEDVLSEVDPALATKMKFWKTHYRGGCMSFWVLKDRPRWKSEDWNPDITQAADFYQAWDSWQEAKESLMAHQNGERVDGRNAELADYGAIDPRGISPEGFVMFRSEEPMPFELSLEGGPERWDEIRDDIAETRNQAMEELAPGFRDRIVQQWVTTPLDVWRYNPAAVGGQIVGGDFSEDQWLLSRMPYRTGVKKLYMANGVWPVAATWMASGYNCASAVAEDLGVRNQSWWSHRPVEWLLRNLADITVKS